jgi:hypothetical protein
MPQASMESGADSGVWLPLTEYSVRSGVSLSTIRRKIKSNTIAYRLEKGRYMLLYPNEKVTSMTTSVTPIEVPKAKPTPEEAPKKTVSQPSRENDESWTIPFIEKAVRMVSDAFEHTLKEKDERIKLMELRNRELEEHINELRSLVRILEEKFQVQY